MLELIENKHYKINEDTNCFEWLYYIEVSGYGRIVYQNRLWLAHRASYKIYKGEIPKGLCVLHRCDVRHCINPDHLFLGTHQDNYNDMIKKNRQDRSKNQKGEEHWNCKLTDKEVFEIRDLYKSKIFNGYQLAELYNVSYQHIYKIINNNKRRLRCLN